MADLLSNGLHEKVHDLVTKRRLDVVFVKKIILEMVIGQQMKEGRLDQNY